MAEQGQRQMSEQAQSHGGEPVVSASPQRAATPCPAPGRDVSARLPEQHLQSHSDSSALPIFMAIRMENHNYFNVDWAIILMAGGCRARTSCHQKRLLLSQKYFENVDLNSTLGNTNQLAGQGQQPSPCRHSSNLSNNFKIRKEILKALQIVPYECQHYIFILIIAVTRRRGK